MAKLPGSVSPAPHVQALLLDGIPRDRAVLAARVGELRVARGWTHHVLAQRAGLHGTYLKQMEAGQRNPGLEQLVRLARAFELSSLEQLFGPLPTEAVM